MKNNCGINKTDVFTPVNGELEMPWKYNTSPGGESLYVFMLAISLLTA